MQPRREGGRWFDGIDKKIWILVALVAIAGSLLCTGGPRAERANGEAGTENPPAAGD